MRACNTRTARTCVSEKEPEHRNQPVPRVAAQSIGVFVALARNTPGQICTRAKARREANQLAARHEYSISLHRNITSADRFAGKGKIETVFLPLRRTAKIGNISPINASLSSGKLPRCIRPSVTTIMACYSLKERRIVLVSKAPKWEPAVVDLQEAGKCTAAGKYQQT